jgi:hypothetical protein
MHFQQITPVSQEPKEVTYQTCIEILKEHSYAIELQELIKIAGERKEQIKLHIGQPLNIEHNWKVRVIKDELLNNRNVILTNSKPIILKWESKRDYEQTIVKADKQASDESEAASYASSNTVDTNPPSDTSDTSNLKDPDKMTNEEKLAYHDKLSKEALRKSRAATMGGEGL